MAETLEPGWYWVRWGLADDWEPAGFTPDLVWIAVDEEGSFIRPPAVIGPRLTPPEEGGDNG